MDTQALSIYLNDHLALMTGETELAQRTARENKSTPLGMFLHRYVGEVAEQRRCVEHLINTLGEEPSVAKQAAGWLLEKVGRLKPNNSLSSYSSLSRLIEVEILMSAATSRRHLWQTLLPHDTNPMFANAGADFARFETEAGRQIDALAEQHAEAASAALGPGKKAVPEPEPAVTEHVATGVPPTQPTSTQPPATP